MPGLLYAGKPVQLKASALLGSFWQSAAAAAVAALGCWRLFLAVGAEWGVLVRLVAMLVSYVVAYLLVTVVLDGGLTSIRRFGSLVGIFLGKDSRG
jgi:hypothetical protein